MANSHTGDTPDANTQLASLINKAIKDKNTSILALSGETNIAYKSLYRSLNGGTNGYRSLSVPEVIAIAEALKVAPNTLLPDVFNEVTPIAEAA